MLKIMTAVKSAATAPAPVELTAPIVYKDEARQIVFGPVLIPDEPDADGDVVTADKIELVAHEFLKNYGTIDVQHTLNYVGRPVESYIATQDLSFESADGSVTVPRGSWMLGVFVEDKGTWERVLRGELTGYSIMAVSRAKVLKDAQPKRVTLADLGQGWVAVAVSLVERPAVPAAKWVAIKSTGSPSPLGGVPLSAVQKTIATLLGIPVVPKEGRKFSEKTLGALRTAHDALGELITEADAERSTKSNTKGDGEVTNEELQQVVKAAVAEAIKPLADRVTGVEKSITEKPATTATAQPPAEGAGSEPDPAVKETLTKINERLAAVEKELAPGSRQPDGQDPTGGAAAPATKAKPEPTRDAFGRRINR